MSFDDVLAAFRGQRFALDAFGGQSLWMAFGPSAGDMEITPQLHRVRMRRLNDLEYPIATAPGVISFLLETAPSNARSLRMRIGPTTVKGGGYPWGLPGRHVLVEAWTSRIVVRVREREAELDDAIPAISEKTFLRLSHACPHCHQVPERYRVLSCGGLVCGACASSSPPPARGPT